MLNKEFPPHPLLAPFVKLIWAFELDDPVEAGPPERILPDGIVERHANEKVEDLVRHVWDRSGQVTVRDMSRELGPCERQLERLFLEAGGTTPKHFARIVRFLNACRQIRDGQENLTRIAHRCGYYDQSHFIRDFKEFSGLTPREFDLRPDVSFLPLD